MKSSYFKDDKEQKSFVIYSSIVCLKLLKRVLCTDIQNSKQDKGKPGGCAEIHAGIYYFILLTGECQETVAKVV